MDMDENSTVITSLTKATVYMRKEVEKNASFCMSKHQCAEVDQVAADSNACTHIQTLVESEKARIF